MPTKKEAKTVWETLSVVDVSEHTEEKNGFTYLSWAWAWSTLKDHYPDATYHKHKFVSEAGTLPFMKDTQTGSAYVEVTVMIPSMETEATETFPVLDYKNQSIADPNSFQVNTALQRCLAKTISILGLGAYIYAGEDLPPAPKDAAVVVSGPSGEDKKAEGSAMIREVFLQFMKGCTTVEELEKFYQTNSGAAAILQRSSKEDYEKVIAAFKSRKAAIVKTQKQGEEA